MQIYNGTGYDLFDNENDADNIKKKLTDLKKVIPR